MKPMWFGLALAALGGCGSRDGGSNRTGPVGSERHAIVPTPGTGPNARTPLAPTMAAIDPRSSEAALQQVSGFARLLNDRKFDQAYMLLGPNAPPRLDFDRQWAAAEALHVTIGEPGGQEGAAGSI